MLQDTLRGQALAALPFYDHKRIAALLDQLPTMTNAGRRGLDPVLMSALSACVLQERFKSRRSGSRARVEIGFKTTKRQTGNAWSSWFKN